MAIYHCQVKNIGRSSGRSAVACSAYRSASEMEDEELGKHFDYTKKHGVEYSNVFLCKNAPEEYADREILWNAVQKVETAKDARLSREFEVALPHDLTNEQQEKLAERFAKSLTDEGMCVQVDIHRIEGNHHAHMMATTRQIKENGEWDTKYKKVYANDRNEQGKPIFNPDKGQTPEDRIPQLNEDGTQKVRIRKGKGEEKLWERVNVQYNEWDKREKIGEWRERWANYTNEALEQAQSQERVTHLSFKAQGKEELPTIHEGYSTIKKEINNEIRSYNAELHSLQKSESFLNHVRSNVINELEQERKEQEYERLASISREAEQYIAETERYYAQAGADYIQAERDRQAASGSSREAEYSIERSRASEIQCGKVTERIKQGYGDIGNSVGNSVRNRIEWVRQRINRWLQTNVRENIQRAMEAILPANTKVDTFERRLENLQSRTDQIIRNTSQARADKALQEERAKTYEKTELEKKLEHIAQARKQSQTEKEAAKTFHAPQEDVPEWQKKFNRAKEQAEAGRTEPLQHNEVKQDEQQQIHRRRGIRR